MGSVCHSLVHNPSTTTLQNANLHCATVDFWPLPPQNPCSRLHRSFKRPLPTRSSSIFHGEQPGARPWWPYLNSKVTDISWHLGLLAAPHRILLYFSEAAWPLANSPGVVASPWRSPAPLPKQAQVEKRPIRWMEGRVPLRTATRLIAASPHRTAAARYYSSLWLWNLGSGIEKWLFQQRLLVQEMSD